jgi:hypothetical protein
VIRLTAIGAVLGFALMGLIGALAFHDRLAPYRLASSTEDQQASKIADYVDQQLEIKGIPSGSVWCLREAKSALCSAQLGKGYLLVRVEVDPLGGAVLKPLKLRGSIDA